MKLKIKKEFFLHTFLFFRMDIDTILKPFDDEQKSIRKFFIYLSIDIKVKFYNIDIFIHFIEEDSR